MFPYTHCGDPVCVTRDSVQGVMGVWSGDWCTPQCTPLVSTHPPFLVALLLPPHQRPTGNMRRISCLGMRSVRMRVRMPLRYTRVLRTRWRRSVLAGMTMSKSSRVIFGFLME